MVELLAPAGDFERLQFAFLYGADAVYLGGQEFSLRANAKNFSREDIKRAVDFAHSKNKKVYVAVNIVFHNENLNGLSDYLLYLGSINVDGIIASDILVVNKIKELNINTKIILSTQASVLNYEAAKFYKSIGVNQIVMAREALKEDIKKVKDETNLEIECFIHGAMCSSISGKCILSNYMTGRDSNRGGCAQICRWVFNEENKNAFTITPKDLNFISQIEEMIDIGVNTFKIEGRMRSIYYISTVILCYRRVIDKILNHSLTENDKDYYLKVLNRVANRESAPQFFDRLPDYNDQYYNLRDEASNQDFLGIVLDYDENNNIAIVEQRNYFKVGDEVEIFGPNTDTFNFKIDELYDENDNRIEVANKPRMIIKTRINTKVHKNDLLRIKIK